MLAHRQWRTHMWTQGVKEGKIERRGRGRKAKFEKKEERRGERWKERKREKKERECEREKRESKIEIEIAR